MPNKCTYDGYPSSIPVYGSPIYIARTWYQVPGTCYWTGRTPTICTVRSRDTVSRYQVPGCRLYSVPPFASGLSSIPIEDRNSTLLNGYAFGRRLPAGRGRRSQVPVRYLVPTYRYPGLHVHRDDHSNNKMSHAWVCFEIKRISYHVYYVINY